MKYRIVFMLIIASFGLVAPTLAQTDAQLALVDQAMQHLSTLLGKPITRDSNPWTWTEKIYPDASLDCPVEGFSYAQVQTVGFQVRITDSGIEYDYRLTADGSVLILCRNGRPHPTSVGIDVPATNDPVEEIIDREVQRLPTSRWWAWAYVVETDTLVLLNPQGDQATLFRPRLPNELTGTTPKLGVSRDGRYLIIAARLNSGVWGVGIYAIETGEFVQVHQFSTNEDIHLGFGYDQSNITGSPYIVGPQSRLVAVGAANITAGTWRVVVFDLTSGAALYQLDNTSPLLFALGSTFTNTSIVFPRVVYFTEDTVHIQLVRFGVGGTEDNLAFAWHPNANFAEPSPYIKTNLDVLPIDGQAVFSYIDTSEGFTGSGPFAPLNAIGIGDIFTPQHVYLNSNFSHNSPRWATGGEQVLFRQEDAAGNVAWYSVAVRTGTVSPLDPSIAAVYGLPDGFLARTKSGAVVLNGNVAAPLWVGPAGTEVALLWAVPLGSTFAPTSIVIPLNLTGIVHCPGTPVSNVAIGFEARVTSIVGGTGLRLRSTPGGEFVRSMPNGTQFVIIGGPQCQGGYTWWNLRLADGTTGWSAEADQDAYFIEPVPDAG